MKAVMIKMQCLTNLHVGNGDVNYNIIDNEVERDPVTGMPTINSSGIKGALRQFFAGHKNENKWFGDYREKSEGALKILSADMMAMPVRASRGEKAFYMVAPKSSKERFEQLVESFGIKGKFAGKDYTEAGEVSVDAIPVTNKTTITGDIVYELADESFRLIELPVMARNCLENGISKNLWYEEIVPHDTIFAFTVIARNDDGELLRAFKEAVDGQVVQFGGNASIGYGLCSLTAIGEV